MGANHPSRAAGYQLVQALPAQLETSLPSIEQIESELGELAPPKPATRRVRRK